MYQTASTVHVAPHYHQLVQDHTKQQRFLVGLGDSRKNILPTISQQFGGVERELQLFFVRAVDLVLVHVEVSGGSTSLCSCALPPRRSQQSSCIVQALSSCMLAWTSQQQLSIFGAGNNGISFKQVMMIRSTRCILAHCKLTVLAAPLPLSQHLFRGHVWLQP